jgi:hypothetical protein
MELPGRLEDAGLRALREHDPFGMTLELLVDPSDETHPRV